mmetsp:Transcript_4716/g.15291  ORF Transcript_4716/g.15291 Transcript_4716/m.15291 type:complete len:297 (+) Transcript_4716:288-1178(+)
MPAPRSSCCPSSAVLALRAARSRCSPSESRTPARAPHSRASAWPCRHQNCLACPEGLRRCRLEGRRACRPCWPPPGLGLRRSAPPPARPPSVRGVPPLRGPWKQCASRQPRGGASSPPAGRRSLRTACPSLRRASARAPASAPRQRPAPAPNATSGGRRPRRRGCRSAGRSCAKPAQRAEPASAQRTPSVTVVLRAQAQGKRPLPLHPMAPPAAAPPLTPRAWRQVAVPGLRPRVPPTGLPPGPVSARPRSWRASATARALLPVVLELVRFPGWPTCATYESRRTWTSFSAARPGQ